LAELPEGKTRKYVFHVLSLILPSFPMPLVFKYVWERISDGEINEQVLGIVNANGADQYMVLNDKLVQVLIGGFLAKMGSVRLLCLRPLLHLLHRYPPTEEILLERKDFLESLLFHDTDNSREVFASIQDRVRLYVILAGFFPLARETAAHTRALFSTLLRIFTDECDVAPLLVQARFLAPDPSFPEVMRFFGRALESKPELALGYESLLEPLFNIAFSNPPALQQQATFCLIGAISAGRAELLGKTLSRCSELLTESDRWGYTAVESVVDDKMFRGLRNLGATCYFNSLLQQLFFNGQFRELLLRADCEGIALALRQLFIRLALSRTRVVDPAPFAKVWLETVDSEWSPRHQEDAFEFLQLLIDKLPNNVQAPFRGRMSITFQGITETSFKKEIDEDFYSLSIPVLNCDSFHESMTSLSAPIMHTGQNQYSDDQLGKIDVKRTCKIVELPQTLILQLKRFRYDLKTCQRTKIPRPFEFPLDFSASDYFEGQTAFYRLAGLVVHRGTAESGHYTSLVRILDQWWEFDDDTSESFTAGYLRHKSFGETDENGCAYLLFYEQVPNRGGVSLDQIRSLLTKTDLAAIQSENSEFDRTQSLFTVATRDFVIQLGSFSLFLDYFFRIFCHSALTQ
jgi:ubiquitin C-terminal hydrolase